MQIPRPTKSRLLVFTVPVKRRIKNSILYTPAPRRGSYSGCQECWIVSAGPEVQEQTLTKGKKAFVHDGFEFEEVKLDHLWDNLQHLPEFKSLKEYVDEVDGSVYVQIVPEGSILAIEED